ncbi:hypothetical protein [Paludisphaera sp.]|uniref:hypothetical protein n=1 Tax=Paludisphaera sp. TaxID=2017432 RepID=UPI00301C25AE
MSTAVKTRKTKSKAKSSDKAERKSDRIEAQDAPRGVEEAVPSHVVGKPAEVEPTERAYSHAEEPEAALRSAEAPDAGYGRCTESSDWENRGRS